MKEKIYNSEHMTTISDEYGQCGDMVDKIISLTTSMQESIMGCYEGEGTGILENTFSKLSQHLDLVKSCMSVAQNYVSSTLADMQELDASIIKDVPQEKR